MPRPYYGHSVLGRPALVRPPAKALTAYLAALNNYSPLALWDAGAGVYSDAGTTPAAPDALVAQLNDQSGNGLHVSQGTDAQKPAYRASVAAFNNRPALQFDGSDRLLRTMAGIVANRTVYGIAVVLATTTTGLISAYSEAHNSVATQRVRLGKNANQAAEFTHTSDAGTAATVNPGTGAMNDGVAHLLYLRRTASNAFAIYLDGVQIGTSTGAPGTSTMEGICLGAWYIGGGFSSHWVGHIAHWSIYPTDVLTTALPVIKNWYDTP